MTPDALPAKRKGKRAPVYICPEHGRWIPPRPPKGECVGCWACYGRYRLALVEAATLRPKGKARGGGQSSKAKGRSACLAVQQALLGAAPHLTEGDVFVKASSQTGVDLHLSPLARAWFRYAIEIKNVELLNIWKALKQAEENASAEAPPVVIFKRANTSLYIALHLEDFLQLLPWPQQTDAPKP